MSTEIEQEAILMKMFLIAALICAILASISKLVFHNDFVTTLLLSFYLMCIGIPIIWMLAPSR